MGIPPVKSDVKLGKNILMDISQDGITLTIPSLNRGSGISKSGKNVMIADTGGPIIIEGYNGLQINLMVFQPVSSFKGELGDRD